MKMHVRRITYSLGFIGSSIVVFSTLLTAFLFRNPNGQPYSFLNQYISELGQPGISKLAPLFNTGLITGGILLAIFMIGLGIYCKSKFTYLVGGIGFISMIGVILVGFFPMNINLAMHLKSAMVFFQGGMITILLFTLFMIFHKKDKKSKYPILPGVVTVLVFLAFLFLPALFNSQHQTLLVPLTNRPIFYLQSFLEWIVFFSMIFVWIWSVSRYLLKSK